jgi:NAD dependent epimerase/dehydratase family enzyme
LLDGVFNLTAPDCPTNRRMLDLLREKVAMPLGLPTAEWMIALGAFLMKTEPELVLKSRWVEPARLIDEGFVFRWPQWSNAVEDLLTREGLAGHFRESSRRSMGLRAWAQA